MNGEPRIELHGRTCACRGGAWVLLEETQRSPCSGEAAAAAETIRFFAGNDYETRAEVTYVSTGSGSDRDGIQRLGLKFLDAPLPESLIPEGARPLP